MQPRHPFLIALVAALLVAGPAAAQTKPKRRAIPPPRPAAAELTTLPAAATSQAPVASPTAGGLGGSARPMRLVGMSPVGDAAPACRAQCSKDRYVCHAAGDPTDCDSRWIPCLQACSPH